jgi:hypothetical protein
MALNTSACIVTRPLVTPQTEPGPRPIAGPAKAHLIDGTTIVYQRGGYLQNDSLVGEGVRYDLRLAPAGPARAIPADSIAAFESHTTIVDGASSAVTTLLFLGTFVALVAISVASGYPLITRF